MIMQIGTAARLLRNCLQKEAAASALLSALLWKGCGLPAEKRCQPALSAGCLVLVLAQPGHGRAVIAELLERNEICKAFAVGLDVMEGLLSQSLGVLYLFNLVAPADQIFLVFSILETHLHINNRSYIPSRASRPMNYIPAILNMFVLLRNKG